MDSERKLGRNPIDKSSQRGIGYDIESKDSEGNLFFIEVKGISGSESVTLTYNEIQCANNSPEKFRLAISIIDEGIASMPKYISDIEWGQAGFGDISVTKNLKQLLSVSNLPHWWII